MYFVVIVEPEEVNAERIRAILNRLIKTLNMNLHLPRKRQLKLWRTRR